MMRKQNIL